MADFARPRGVTPICQERKRSFGQIRQSSEQRDGNQMMFISMPDVKEAERLSKVQRIQAGRWLRVDESKIIAPKDMMLLQ
ncbi:MAG: hypothetical protein V4527_01820 [Pseudomonadota bacterium]